jgi:hypothetical protein
MTASDRPAHLRVARPGELSAQPSPASQPPLVRSLNRAATLRIDQAETFLLSLDSEMRAPDTARAAYLLGVAGSHLANMIELLKAVAA